MWKFFLYVFSSLKNQTQRGQLNRAVVSHLRCHVFKSVKDEKRSPRLLYTSYTSFLVNWRHRRMVSDIIRGSTENISFSFSFPLITFCENLVAAVWGGQTITPSLCPTSLPHPTPELVTSSQKPTSLTFRLLHPQGPWRTQSEVREGAQAAYVCWGVRIDRSWHGRVRQISHSMNLTFWWWTAIALPLSG